MKRPDSPQPLALGEAIVPVAALIILVASSYFLFGDAGAAGPNQVALVLATMIAVFIGWRRGHRSPCSARRPPTASPLASARSSSCSPSAH
jgi:Na+:H+ antiporter, NhaC family